MVTIIICVVLAYGLKEAAEDVIRTWRGDPPPAQRTGLRGAIEHGWSALADRHQRAVDAGHISKYGYWKRKWHLSREKALSKAGFETEEEIARGAAEHRHRLGLIAKGIDPDTLPPLFPVRGRVWEPAEPEPIEPETVADANPDAEPEPAEPGVTIDGHYYDNVQVWLNPEYFPPEPDGTHYPQPGIDDYFPPEPGPEDQPWSPYAPTSTDTKETSMSNNGEITGPAAVLQFHNDLKVVLDGTSTLTDTIQGRAGELQTRVDEVAANLTATENAASGMRKLGMNDAAAAADALMEVQQEVHDALLQLRLDHDTAVSELIDQAAAAQAHLAAIKAAHDAQLSMQDARAGAGLGNLATDEFLDGND